MINLSHQPQRLRSLGKRDLKNHPSGRLRESANPRRYWPDLKSKLINHEGFSQLYEKIVQKEPI